MWLSNWLIAKSQDHITDSTSLSMTCTTLPIISRQFAHRTLQIRAILYASYALWNIHQASWYIVRMWTANLRIHLSHTPMLISCAWHMINFVGLSKSLNRNQHKIGGRSVPRGSFGYLKSNTCKLANYNNYAIVSNRYSLSRQNAWMRRKTWSKT